MPDKGQLAVDKFVEGYNCAQSVVFAFHEECGLGEDAALKVSGGFGGGMGRKQEVCGAVTGGIMILGLRRDRAMRGSPVTEDLHRATREFMDGFAARNGSYLCRDLLSGGDLITEEGYRRVVEAGLFAKVCKECVRSAAEMLEKMA
ncbi:MAG: C-GCAxxG-C-C family protein [Bryobacteraceae bacterium]